MNDKIDDICGGTYELCSLASKGRSCPCPTQDTQTAQSVAQAPVQATYGTDSAESYAPRDTMCGWCSDYADFRIQTGQQSHPDFACAEHFRAYFPHLDNAQHRSALCPDVEHGCSHTMAVNEEGYGVACVEYADAHGIQWIKEPVSLVKDYGLPHSVQGADLSLDYLRHHPCTSYRLLNNDPIQLQWFFAFSV